MKVLALNGSPRRGGNTELLLEETLKGVKEIGGEVTLYHLNTLSLTACQQCGACDDAGICVIADDMQSIYEDIQTADRIIVASPIFFFSVSAQTKTVIDRCQPFWSQKYLHKKPVPSGPQGRKGMLLLVGGMKQNGKNEGFHCAEVVVKAFFRTVNVQEHTTLAYGDVDEKGVIKGHPTALQEAYEAGKKLLST